MHANHLESRRRAHSIYQGLKVVKIKDLHKTSAHDVVKQRAQTSHLLKSISRGDVGCLRPHQQSVLGE